MKQKLILVGAAVVYKKVKDKPVWFIVKQKEDSDWEIAKTNARRGESSVRAVIRMMGEQAAMNVKVQEEVGRTAGAAMVAGNTRKLKSKKDLAMLKSARDLLKELDKKKKKK